MTSAASADDRQKLEQAIALLQTQRDLLGDEIVETSLAALRRQLAELERQAQRRQRKLVTLLFADIVDSTRMIHDLDPEDSLAVMDTALRRLSVPIERHGGRVTRYMGDGLMAVFGLPVARENDADRAVFAGLSLLDTARDYAARLKQERNIADFQIRVGINTGWVAAGGVTEAADTIMGSAVHLGARMESIAEPDTVYISHDTYQHVRGLFDLKSRAPVVVKGFSQPVAVYRVLRAKKRSFRTHRRGVEGVETRMIGREGQLRLLRQAYHAVLRDRKLRAVTIVGEAGIGKSRLLYELENWLDLQPDFVQLHRGHARLETQALPYGLLRDLLAFRFHILDDDHAHVVNDKIVRGFAEALGPGEKTVRNSYLVGRLLGYNFAHLEHAPALPSDPAQISDRSIAYLTEFFAALAERDPLVILLEDVHWADESSLDALFRLVRNLRNQPALLIAAARPSLYERRSGWLEELPFHQRMVLQPLDRLDSARLVADVFQQAVDVPATLQNLIVTNAEGNPFYLEELIKVLIADGVILTDETPWRVQVHRLNDLRVPATLAGVLQARIDRLPDREREILQQASVVGRIFWDKAVAYINREENGPTEQDISTGLHSLHQREMVFRHEQSAFADATEHAFKHALLRQITYESVLKKVRRAYHSLVADWLMRQSARQALQLTGLIADHLAQAGRTDETLSCLRRAAEEAVSRFANEEAVDFLSRALVLAPADALQVRFDLLSLRVDAYNGLGNRSAQRADLETMDSLAAQLADLFAASRAALAWSAFHHVTGENVETVAASRRAVELAVLNGDLMSEAAGHLNWARALWRIGSYQEAGEHLEHSLRLARAVGDRRLEGLALLNQGNVIGDLGDLTAARRKYQQALTIARETDDLIREAHALNNLGIIAADLGEFASARDYFEQALAVARETGNMQVEGMALGNLGHVTADLAEFALSRTYFEQYLVCAVEISNRQGEGFALTGLANAQLQLDNHAEAAELYQRAIELREAMGQEHLAMDSRAGLARALLAQGEKRRAVAIVDQIIGYLDASDNAAAGKIFTLYVTCIHALQGAADQRAGPLLAEAYHLLQAAAADLPDEETRRRFLEEVPSHQEILALWIAANRDTTGQGDAATAG